MRQSLEWMVKALPRIFSSALLVVGVTGFQAQRASAETGYDLWLRYVPVFDGAKRDEYRRVLTAIVVEGQSPTANVVRTELTRALPRLLGRDVPVASAVRSAGALLVGTPSSSRLVAGLGLEDALSAL